MSETDQLVPTPLFEEHLAAGARMVPFVGFSLPVQYTSLVEEHRAVRTRAGLFDVSHMGEIFIRGAAAFAFVQRVSCNDHGKLTVGRAQYTGLMYPEGTFVDDVLVHRLGEEEWLLVVNAANRHKDFAYLAGLAAGEPELEVADESDRWAQVALQGPVAMEALQGLTDTDLGSIRYYRFEWGEVAGQRALIARTGYTGEDGYELYLEPAAAAGVWREILRTGKADGVVPAGLGARDTLRLEAGMCLYGNDIDARTTPIEANLQWIVKLDKGDFIGRDELERQLEEGVERRLAGFEVVDRGIGRHGHPVFLQAEGGDPIGEVTSGTHSPTLDRPIGMAYVPPEHAVEGTQLWLEIRGRRVRARVVGLPFYSRKRKAAASPSS